LSEHKTVISFDPAIYHKEVDKSWPRPVMVHVDISEKGRYRKHRLSPCAAAYSV